MSDALLGRIAAALEALVTKAGAEIKVVAAEAVAEVAKVVKPRGRPVKGGDDTPAPSNVNTAASPGAATATSATAAEVDPFEIEAKPAVKLELTDVRAALVAYQKATSPETARKKLKEVGGVDSLASLPADKFQAVVDSLK